MTTRRTDKLVIKEGDNPFDQSTFYFFASALGVFGAGMCTGVFIAMRHLKEKENFHFDIRKHRTPAIMATRAFGYGSLLCLGTFGVLSSAFCYAADIRSVRDFDRYMRNNLEVIRPEINKDPAVQRERELVEKLSESQQMEYVWKKYFEDDAQVVKELPDGPEPEHTIPESGRTVLEQVEYIRNKYFPK